VARSIRPGPGRIRTLLALIAIVAIVALIFLGGTISGILSEVGNSM
jgi:hypothetical protein